MKNVEKTTLLLAISSAMLAGCTNQVKVSSTLDDESSQRELNHPEKPTYKYEKCYGIAKKAQNHCFSPGASCAGTAKEDNQKNAWIYIPKGTCQKIVGGSLEYEGS